MQKRANNLLEKKYEQEPAQKIQKKMSSTSDQQQKQQEKEYHKFNMWRVDSMYNPAVCKTVG